MIHTTLKSSLPMNGYRKTVDSIITWVTIIGMKVAQTFDWGIISDQKTNAEC